MSYYLLDTDAVIDYFAGFTSSVSLIQDLHNWGDVLCVSDVVIAEVYSGLKPAHRDKALGLLAACFFLTTSLEAARRAGQWRYDHARRGIALSTTTVLVAATAYVHGATIVTGNINDYPMTEVSILPLPRVKH